MNERKSLVEKDSWCMIENNHFVSPPAVSLEFSLSANEWIR